MNCRKARRCLFSYFKNELSEEEKAEVKLHLEGCPECAREALEVERIASLVEESLETLTPSPGFNQKLLSQVQRLPSEEVKEIRKTPFSLTRILGLETKIKWAFAGCFIVIILASVLWFTHKRAPIRPEPISREGQMAEDLQLVNQEERTDSLYREFLRRLMEESQFKPKTYVIENLKLAGSRGVDGMEKLEDIRRRFIIETAGYGVDERRMRSNYVLPVVSTQKASAKVNY